MKYWKLNCVYFFLVILVQISNLFQLAIGFQISSTLLYRRRKTGAVVREDEHHGETRWLDLNELFHWRHN